MTTILSHLAGRIESRVKHVTPSSCFAYLYKSSVVGHALLFE